MKATLATVLLFSVLLFSCEGEKKRVLVFSKTAGFRHESIADGKLALMEMGRLHGFEVDTTEDASFFHEDNLRRYRAVVFLNTTQDVLDPAQQGDFKRYIQAGGGFVGIHAAADTEYEWPWYGRLVGAWFVSHPHIQSATLTRVSDFGENATPDTWTHTDEWYNYRDIYDSIRVIYNLDESSYQGGTNGDDHPIAWYHEFDGGRSFYTGLGHTRESYTDSLFLAHLLEGIRYAMGGHKPDYRNARAARVPEENRFTKTVLDFNLHEPIELTVLPDGRVLFIERHGTIKLYKPGEEGVKTVNRMKVFSRNEDGLIGLTSDPDFKNNNQIYLFYSHPERSANVLSRFVFTGDSVDLSSEKVILEVPVQRETCCHTGGSLAFGPDGNLYISTGDNTNPFESNGFSPSDERPGRSPFDAQSSSANTNDLRGKILRIKLQADASYTIPEGNLFPVGEPDTRPEIYVMGCRNPYRISIDPKTGFLYWGDVGPDAPSNDSTRGPMGYDELNQARQAGFFGWPYFVGNNYPYSRYDFANQRAGAFWDVNAPVNASPNNTGKRELPPVSPPFIWYPYGKSTEYPMVRTGSRNAMAGPFYYSDRFRGIETAFPAYFDGKLIFYDWMRNFIFLVSMDDHGNIMDIEPFMPNTTFNNISDMEFGPDGRLYMIEYGTKWVSQNLDARLVRIDYNKGNRPPVANLQADRVHGPVPLTVNFSAEGTTDADGDKLTYVLTAANKSYSSADGNFSVTFDEPGLYQPELKVTDAKGLSQTAKVQVIAGNDQPVVEATIVSGNRTFFFPGAEIAYKVDVRDREDGSTEDGSINDSDVRVTFSYLEGFDMTAVAQGHQMPTAELPGKRLIDESDCKSCHLVDERSAGPSYKEIADRYAGQEGATDLLAGKILKGGSGVWGQIAMAAHPQVSVDDARQMVNYILSLKNPEPVKYLPRSGTVATPAREGSGAYMLVASYYDKGGDGLPSIGASASLALRSPTLSADQAQLHEVTVLRHEGHIGFDNVRHHSWALFKDIDLTGIRKLTFGTLTLPDQAGGTVEFRTGSPDGDVVAEAKVNSAGMVMTTATVKKTDGVHDLCVVFKNPDAGDKKLFYFGRIHLYNK